MDIGKSIELGIIHAGTNKTRFANKLGVSPQYLTELISKDTCSGPMMIRLCEAFDMKASELVALGE